MDHKFLWCATSVVLNDIMCASLDNYLITDVTITRSSVYHNEYLYDVKIGDNEYEFTYKFDSNTFISGILVVTDSLSDKNKPITYIVKRCGDAIRIGYDTKTYTEMHDYNHEHIIAIHTINGKKDSIDSIVINSKEIVGSTTEKNNITVNSCCVGGNVPDVKQLHFDLFAVSGALDKKQTLCTDVVTLRSNKLKMTLYDGDMASIIIVDTFPRWGNKDSVGYLTVINSDFNQEYEYKYDKAEGCYDVTEYVRDRNDNRVIKRHFVYFEEDHIITVPDHDSRFKIALHDTNVEFVKC